MPTPSIDPVAVALEALARAERMWSGTPTHLHTKLADTADPKLLADPRWPRTAQILGNAVARTAPLLAERGVRIVRRHSGKTLITLSLAEI